MLRPVVRPAAGFPGLAVLSEPPRAHIVCRVCGRISPVPLETEQELLLERLALSRPDGWTVDRISFSLTGACARCREGRMPGV